MEMTVSQARQIHAKGYAVIMNGDTHNYFVVKDDGEEADDAESKRVP